MYLLKTSIFLIIVVAILVSGVFGNESESSKSEELSSESISTEIDYSTSTTGSTTTNDESLTDEDSTSSLSTTITPSPNESEDNVGHHEEPKLPVDLLSEDILLDPNVVLARVARDVKSRRDLSRYNEFYYHPRQRPSRRTDQSINFRSPVESDQRNNDFKKLRIYPVFPGKK